MWVFMACSPVKIGGDGGPADARVIYDASTDADEPPESCDGDGDGWIHPHPSCDEERAGEPPDCDDTRDDVHPGAPTICGDDAVNNCLELPPAVQEAFGVEEIGYAAVDPIYLGEVGGFHNNVSIAEASGNNGVAFVTANESASIARVLRVDLDDPTNATPMETFFPQDVITANTAVSVVQLSGNNFRVGSVGRRLINYTYNYRPIFADFTATDTSVTFTDVTPGDNCFLAGEPDDRLPFMLHGLTSRGWLFFEVASPETSTLRAFCATPETVVCRNLVDEGVTYDEYGTQLIASSSLATGMAGGARIWTWDYPIGYDDFHFYEASHAMSGQGALLARNIQADDPVFYAYAYNGTDLGIDVMSCTGLDACSRLDAFNVSTGASIRDLGIAPLGTGAVMAVALQPDGYDGPVELQLRFLGAGGDPLGGDFAIPGVGIGYDPSESYRFLDVTTAPPSIARDWHDILLAIALTRTSTDQPELRLVQARACNAM